ncbi:MAG: protein CapI [Hyphomicrobiales bacterium]|nr:MAG: protein CapI [Hyphomicrobiales bacterium]
MTYLVTGVAGFIGFNVARRLLERGERVIGIDNLNDYYAVALKKARLAALAPHHNHFRFVQADIAEIASIRDAISGEKLTKIIHLAAQAGVRYSIDHPETYGSSNLTGHLNMLEIARNCDTLERMVYASSSSVYGGNTKLPFSEDDPVEKPVSLYAATKRADELMSVAYSNLYDLPLIGLRFFTVYGPWGRPDMALWKFAKAICEDRPIAVYNNGDMRRDFTYIDDIVSGVLAVADQTPARAVEDGHRLYNIGNNKPEALMDLIGFLERGLGKEAEKEFLPMQLGDVKETFADISRISGDYGFAPTTSLEVGVAKFVDWFKANNAHLY